MKKSGFRTTGAALIPALALAVFPAGVFAQSKASSNAAPGGAADGAVAMTAEEAVEYALRNSRQLQSGAIDLEIKKRASDTAWNALLPSAQVSGTMSRTNEIASASKPSDPTESDHWRAAGNASLSLGFSAATLESIRAAHVGYESGLITREQAFRQTERDVRKLFYSLLLAQESLALQENSLESAKSRAAQAEISYRNGKVPELSLLQAKVAYQNQEPQVLKLRQSLAQSLDTFAFLLGMSPGTKIRLKGEIAPAYYAADADALIREHLGARLDMQALDKNIEQLAAQKAALDLQAFTPALQAGWSYQPTAGVTALKNNWADNGGLSLTLSWDLANLLPWSQSRQGAKDLEANIRKLELAKSTLRDQAVNEIRQLAAALELSRTQIEASRANIALAQRACDMTALSYRNGTTELLDLRDAESSLNQAKLGLLNERFSYLSGVLDLEYALNAKLAQ
ncbi:TolC family protein [Treponema endosymbiont of Eucomonympha sp.]|uniref:TolC family protein n=1 Tax=Treponema endosymbiont of Eucomonympha sp. TaxID=1580831 RepID=UPI000781BEA0|nr:TolC family protein [Treponema endosymbiont of Eucomonympha sp.]